MSEPISFGELDFNLVASKGEPLGASRKAMPFCILVMGDFSGRASCGRTGEATPMPGLKPLRVDRDTINTLMAELGVQIHLPLFGKNTPPVSISFSELEDFHPDTLYRRLDLFQPFRETKKRLKDPSMVAALSKDLLKAPSPKSDPPLPEPDRETSSAGLLDQIIEKSQSDDQKNIPVKPESDLDAFLHDIVRPHLVPRAHPRLEEMITALDAASSELMQRILHHESFQALEAAWRGLFLLVSRLETDHLLTLSLLDVSKAELAAALADTEDLSNTALYRLWADPAAESADHRPWAVVAGNYLFEKQASDLSLLGRMAKIAAAAGISFVSAAGDRFLCNESLADTPDPDDWTPGSDQGAEDSWMRLRHLDEAASLGLALPRILLRLPYGDNTDPVDSFQFEEMPTPPVHKKYLWGNPCFALALLLGQAFSLHGWRMEPGHVQEIDDLPLHVYEKDGTSFLKPCAEACLGQRAAEQILDRGLMPLLSFLNRDMVRLGRFQSVADPLRPLAGPWQ